MAASDYRLPYDTHAAKVRALPALPTAKPQILSFSPSLVKSEYRPTRISATGGGGGAFWNNSW